MKKELYLDKYQLIACDGSAVDIYRNPNDPDTFFEPNGKSTRGFNQIHINAFYSILDRRFTDLVIQPCRKRNEYRAFSDMVDAANPHNFLRLYKDNTRMDVEGLIAQNIEAIRPERTFARQPRFKFPLSLCYHS